MSFEFGAVALGYFAVRMRNESLNTLTGCRRARELQNQCLLPPSLSEAKPEYTAWNLVFFG